MAREAGGRFLLRLEDIDMARCRPEYTQGIFDDLKWLGLSWEQPVRRQSEHFSDYDVALEQLSDMGLIYASFLTRKQIEAAAAAESWPRDPLGISRYTGTERGLNQAIAAVRIARGEDYCLRLNMEKALDRVERVPGWTETGSGVEQQIAADPAAWGDVILARKETPTSYHLSVTVDDALQGVTHVVRGLDLYHATSIHRLLQVLLGLPEPIYHHHRLIGDQNGPKLSKSAGSSRLCDMREHEVTANMVRKELGFDPIRAG